MFIEETSTLPGNYSNNYGNYYGNSSTNNDRLSYDLVNTIKEFISFQNICNTMVEEKLHRVDDFVRNMDIIALDVETLKIIIFPPKHYINDSIKSIEISINDSNERVARSRVK